MVETSKRYDCDGCYEGPFLEKELEYEYGMLLCSKCLRTVNRVIFRERIKEWIGILKELVK